MHIGGIGFTVYPTAHCRRKRQQRREPAGRLLVLLRREAPLVIALELIGLLVLRVV